LNLFRTTQAMVMKYEDSRATTHRETIAFRAVEEPMLMQARIMVRARETRTARMGMFEPGLT